MGQMSYPVEYLASPSPPDCPPLGKFQVGIGRAMGISDGAPGNAGVVNDIKI
jgi:hypothetical protein